MRILYFSSLWVRIKALLRDGLGLKMGCEESDEVLEGGNSLRLGMGTVH